MASVNLAYLSLFGKKKDKKTNYLLIYMTIKDEFN